MDDRLEENHETFTVTLRTPHNAVLGQRSSAIVEILDPRGGGTQTWAWTQTWTWSEQRSNLVFVSSRSL